MRPYYILWATSNSIGKFWPLDLLGNCLIVWVTIVNYADWHFEFYNRSWDANVTKVKVTILCPITQAHGLPSQHTRARTIMSTIEPIMMSIFCPVSVLSRQSPPSLPTSCLWGMSLQLPHILWASTPSVLEVCGCYSVCFPCSPIFNN